MSKKAPKKKPELTIEDWCVVGNEAAIGLCCLNGVVNGHPKCGDGRLTTSCLQYVPDDMATVTTYNTVYKLGQPMEGREKHSLRLLEAFNKHWKERNGSAEGPQARA